jgi:hypothetical protein
MDNVACIDPETLSLVLPFKGAVTGEQWKQITWPSYPRCGEIIDVDRVDVTEIGQMVRRYMPGRWECPNECDPRNW